MMDEKRRLYGLSHSELKEIVANYSMPDYVANQIADWLYKKHVSDIDLMTNLSKDFKSKLKECYRVGIKPPLECKTSIDGSKKYLFLTDEGEYIEAAYIPDAERATLCVSSQAGCRMGCKFCATAKIGFRHSLSTFDILNQIEAIPERDTLTNIVFMGMGEPLDNFDNVLPALNVLTSSWGYAWSPTKITLSTSGVLRTIADFLQKTKVHLAISLHSPFHQQREMLMPIEKAYHIEDVVSLLRQYDFSHQRRLSFEYILLDGINDTPRHLEALCRLLKGLSCRINIIRFNKIPSSPYFSPSMDRMIQFRDYLTAHGIQTTIRKSKGEDIEAACGLLSATKEKTQLG